MCIRDRIRCTLPIPDTAYPGHYSLHVYNPTGISPPAKEDAASDAFTVTAPTPAVTGLSPNSALVGTWIGTVTVSGTGFANGADVAIGNNSTWIYANGETFINATRIECSLFIPSDAYIGSYTVWVLSLIH